MRYNALLEEQKKFDVSLIKGIYKQEFVTQSDHEAFLTQKLFGLMVEVAEIADAKTREDKLEESIDVLKFILSSQHTMGLKVINGINEIKELLDFIPNIVTGISTSRLTLNLFIYISRLANATRCFKYWSGKESEPKEVLEPLMLDVVTGWLCLMKKYGFTAEEIEQAYMEKNHTNYKRQEEGY